MFNWLINRAKRTPYRDLPGYMRRHWLVPYGHIVARRGRWVPGLNDAEGYFTVLNDGTGPVNPWRRPIARLLQKLGIAVRIHEILRSDIGRDPHDHPFSYLTVILKGGYFESRYNDQGQFLGAKFHGPGSVLYRPAGSWHRLDVPNGMTVTTLFITSKYVGTWGFNVKGKKVPHDEYERNGS